MQNNKLGQVAETVGGTVDAITLTFKPIPASLTNNLLISFRATGANTSTAPTANADGTGAKNIVKKGGVALEVGDIPGANAMMSLCYDLANDRYELLNPGVSGGGDESDLAIISAFRFLTKN